MSTPLYKFLKSNGTTVYTFPGAEEDINQQGDNYKISFNKFVLLNLPKSQTALSNEPVLWDFENSFYSASTNPASNYSDRVVNSLRNYVANHEVTMRNSRISNTEFFYDNSVLQTNSERVFWKWMKKMNLIQFEPAVSNDEYFGDLAEFDSNSITDNQYLPEFLWKEREVSENYLSSFYESSVGTNNLEVEYNGTINYKVGDWIEFTNVENINFPSISKYAEVIEVLEPSGSDGYRVVYDITYTGDQEVENVGYSKLVYNKLVRYIGEIQGNNNVVSQNKFYDQIMAFVPDNAGETPDVLFRTTFDDNYAPDLSFPILPSQYQPEIIGSENFNSPILKSPENYPGDQYAQYDNDDSLDNYNYLTKSGDQLRRKGDYFGTSGDINTTSFDGSTIDGIQLDFDTSHYVKMNIAGDESNNFDEFNTKKVNGEFPSDFEFNSVLWYYTVEDSNGNSATNLYGISFIDSPNNNDVNTGTQFPVVKKRVATDNQDGTSYQLSLNKHTIISTDNPIPSFDNSYVNNLFGFNLFNEVMRRLIVFNDSALNIITENKEIIEDVNRLRQLVYTTSDIESINNQINQLNNLLKLYSTSQIVTTDSIKVELDSTVSPPEIRLTSIEGSYNKTVNINTSDLYNNDGNLPLSVSVPEGKNFIIKVNNDDSVSQELPNNQVLNVYLNSDLHYKQSVDIIVDGTENSTENKRLSIQVQYSSNPTSPISLQTFKTIDLPVYYNTNEQDQNTAFKWNQIKQDITKFSLNNDGETVGMSASRVSGLKKGDSILIENVLFGTDDLLIDGQYIIDSVNELSNTINIDYTQNDNLSSYIDQELTNGNLSSGDEITDYLSMGSFRLNKGYKISITRIDDSNTSSFSDRYLITQSLLS